MKMLEKNIESVNDLVVTAIESLKENGFDRPSTRKELKRLIDDAVMDMIVEWSLDQIIEDASRRIRLAAFHNATNPNATTHFQPAVKSTGNAGNYSGNGHSGNGASGNGSGRVQAWSSMAGVSLMDIEIRPGLPLRNCRRDDLLTKAAEVRTISRGTFKYALFLEKVARKLAPEKKVGEDMVILDLIQVMERAEREAGETI